MVRRDAIPCLCVLQAKRVQSFIQKDMEILRSNSR